MTHQVSTRVNGAPRAGAVEARTSLADFLREDCGLTGTHLGCEHGVCGACTVLVDGAPMRSCIVYAVQVNGCAVETVEGFEDDAIMESLRRAFSEHHALQCGFCTPGMLITAQDIVRRLGAVDEQRIREELAGNLCRCTGYVGIVRAIQDVARSFPDGAPPLAVPKPPVTVAGDAARRPRPAGGAAPEAVAAPPRAAAPASVARQGDGFSISQSILVHHPLDEVWAVLRDPNAVAACLPGAELTGAEGDRLEGLVQVRMGPVKARFLGAATYVRDDAGHAGAVTGGGRDTLSNSRIEGRMSFTAHAPDSASTRLDVSLSFTLQGLLAQFSRPSIVNDFTAYMISQFTDNLARRLEGGAAASGATPGAMDGFKMLRWWLARLFRRRGA